MFFMLAKALAVIISNVPKLLFVVIFLIAVGVGGATLIYFYW